MGKLGKGNGHQHDFPGKNVQNQPELVVAQLEDGPCSP